MSEYFRKPIVKTIMLKGEKGDTGDSDYQPAVDALGKRIDNLILSSGTESSAEVIDARTGYDGTAYSTLGTAIRSQVTNLNNDLAKVQNGVVDSKEIVSTIRTQINGTYTLELPYDTDNYSYEITIENTSSSSGYFEEKIYSNGEYHGYIIKNKLLDSNDTIKFSTPLKITGMSVVITNPNNNSVIITVARKNIKINNYNNLFLYQFCYNEFKSENPIQAFPANKIPSNGNVRFIKITNNSANGGYVFLKVQDNATNVVYEDSEKTYLAPNESYIANIGNVDVRYIFIKNPDNLSDVSVVLYENENRTKIYCGANRKYTKFIDALNYANSVGNCDVYVDNGVYDLISEIGENNLETYIFPKTSGHGPYIGNNNRLYLSSGAYIKCEYEGTSKIVNSDFAILNVCYKPNCGDFEIHGGHFIGKNIRYCVHDENTGISEYTHKYYNCDMRLDNTSNANWKAKQCIGGGLGQYGTVIIDGGIYNSVGIESQNEKGTITYHNPDKGTSTTFKNTVIIKNVYFESGTCYVSCLGDDTSTDAAMFICNNCSMLHEPYANGLDNPQVNHNVTIKKWNNEIRTS